MIRAADNSTNFHSYAHSKFLSVREKLEEERKRRGERESICKLALLDTAAVAVKLRMDRCKWWLSF